MLGLDGVICLCEGPKGSCCRLWRWKGDDSGVLGGGSDEGVAREEVA